MSGQARIELIAPTVSSFIPADNQGLLQLDDAGRDGFSVALAHPARQRHDHVGLHSHDRLLERLEQPGVGLRSSHQLDQSSSVPTYFATFFLCSSIDFANACEREPFDDATKNR